MNRFSTPEEVFGNISLKALNGELEGQNGKEEYRRITENMLPEADIAFLDEIWKASPAILNTLLTIVNERKFHNGSRVMDVPLKALFAASNELPAKDRGLEALYDRFILRIPVNFIKDEDCFFDMIDQPQSSDDFEISNEDRKLLVTNEEWKKWRGYYDKNLKKHIYGEIDKVSLSEEAKSVISAIRKELTARNAAMGEEDKKNGELFEVGDRRWKKITHILKASAFLNDRAEVDLMDCQLIEYCIWSTEKQQKEAREIVEKCIKQNGLDCDTALEDIEEQIEEFNERVKTEWFEDANAPKMYEMNDGQEAYRIVTPQNITSYNAIKPFYLCADYEHDGYDDRKGAYYDSNKEFIGDYDYYFEEDTFEIDGNTASWTDGHSSREYSFEIEMNQRSSVPKKFSDIAHATLQKNFDKDHYTPIVDKIQSEIASLKAQKEKDAIPFKANLFANQEYNKSITAKLDDAIHQLEDAKVNLDKQRARYFKSALAPKLSVGDVILKNGSAFTAAEIENLTDEQKESVIAVVCIAGEKTYAMGIEGKVPSAEYPKGWIEPGKDLTKVLFENNKNVEESLKALGGNNSICGLIREWTLS